MPKKSQAAPGRLSEGHTQPPVPLAVGLETLSHLLGVSPRTLRGLSNSGRIPRPIHLGRRRVWCVAEVQKWLEAGAPERARWEAMRSGGGR